jgi:hypothetical protein
MTSDLKSAVLSTSQAGQPEASKAEQKPEGTPQELREVITQVFNEAWENARREEQRQRDKLESRINKRFMEMRGIAEITGEVTPEKETALRNLATKTVQSEIAADASPATPAPVKQEDKRQAEALDLLLAEVQGLNRKHGAEILESDPEAKALDGVTGTYDFLKAYEAALAAKKQRTSTNMTVQTAVVGGVAGTAETTLADNYRTEVMANRGKEAKIKAIREDYKKKGLDVDHVPFHPKS